MAMSIISFVFSFLYTWDVIKGRIPGKSGLTLILGGDGIIPVMNSI